MLEPGALQKRVWHGDISVSLGFDEVNGSRDESSGSEQRSEQRDESLDKKASQIWKQRCASNQDVKPGLYQKSSKGSKKVSCYLSMSADRRSQRLSNTNRHVRGLQRGVYSVALRCRCYAVDGTRTHSMLCVQLIVIR